MCLTAVLASHAFYGVATLQPDNMVYAYLFAATYATGMAMLVARIPRQDKGAVCCASVTTFALMISRFLLAKYHPHYFYAVLFFFVRGLGFASTAYLYRVLTSNQ